MLNRERAELDSLIDQTPHGETRKSLLRKAWELSDAEHDYPWQMYYRLEYMDEVCFHGDCMESYIIFPEILKLYDEEIKKRGQEEYESNILWKYKFLFDNAPEFYQISIQQYEKLWQDAKQRYQKCGYSLRPLYQNRHSFYENIDSEEAEKAYQEFEKCPRDSMSDCHACERGHTVNYLLHKYGLEKAIEYAEPLMNGQLSCTEQPEAVKGNFLEYYCLGIIEGKKEYVEIAASLCEDVRKSIDKKEVALFHIPTVLLFYVLAKPRKALNYYKKYCNFMEENRNPNTKYWFAIAVLRFLKNLGDKKTYKMILPSSFALYNEDDIYDVESLRKYYMDAAVDIALKIDNRNGTSVYMDRLNRFLQ